MKKILLYKYIFIFNNFKICSLETEKHLSVSLIQEPIEEKSLKNYKGNTDIYNIFINYKEKICENSTKDNLYLFKIFIKEIFSFYFLKKSIKGILHFFFKYIIYLVIFFLSIYFLFFYGIKKYFIKADKVYFTKKELFFKTIGSSLDKIIYNKPKENISNSDKILYNSVSTLLEEIKKKYTCLSNKDSEILIENINKLIFHSNKIEEAKEIFKEQNMKKITKEFYLDLMTNTYWSLDIFINLLEKNLITEKTIKNLLSIINFLLPTSEKILHALCNVYILKSCKEALKLLIKRQMESNTLKLFTTKINKETGLLDLKEINKNTKEFLTPFAALDKEFYIDIINIFIYNMKNYLDSISLGFFYNLGKKYIVNLMDKPHLSAIIYNIFLININFSKLIYEYKLKHEDNTSEAEQNIVIHAEKIKKDEKILTCFINAPFIKEDYIQNIFSENAYIKKKQNNKFFLQEPNYTNIDFIDKKSNINKIIGSIFNIYKDTSVFYKNVLKKISNLLNKINEVSKKESIFKQTKDKKILEIQLSIKQLILYILKNFKNEDIVYFVKHTKENILKILKFIPDQNLQLLINFLNQGKKEDYIKLIFNFLVDKDNQNNKQQSEELYNLLIEVVDNAKFNTEEITIYIHNLLVSSSNMNDLLKRFFNRKNINSKENFRQIMELLFFTKNMFNISFEEDYNIEKKIRILKNLTNNRHTCSEEKSFLDVEGKLNKIEKFCDFLWDYDFNAYAYIEELVEIIIGLLISKEYNKILKIKNILKIIVKKKNIKNKDPLIFLIEESIKNVEYHEDIMEIITITYEKIQLEIILKNIFQKKDYEKQFKKECFNLILEILKDNTIIDKIIDLLNKIYLNHKYYKIINKCINFNPQYIIQIIRRFLINEINLINYSLPSNIILINILKNLNNQGLIKDIVDKLGKFRLNIVSKTPPGKSLKNLLTLSDENKFNKRLQEAINYTNIIHILDVVFGKEE
jgi:hypothetical protein